MQFPSQAGERLPRDVEGGIIGPLQDVLKRGWWLYLDLERKIVRRILRDQGDRHILTQRCIHQGEEPPGTIIECDQRDPRGSRGNNEAVPEGSTQIKLDTRSPLGGRWRAGYEAIDCKTDPEENAGQGRIGAGLVSQHVLARCRDQAWRATNPSRRTPVYQHQLSDCAGSNHSVILALVSMRGKRL